MLKKLPKITQNSYIFVKSTQKKLQNFFLKSTELFRFCQKYPKSSRKAPKFWIFQSGDISGAGRKLTGLWGAEWTLIWHWGAGWKLWHDLWSQGGHYNMTSGFRVDTTMTSGCRVETMTWHHGEWWTLWRGFRVDTETTWGYRVVVVYYLNSFTYITGRAVLSQKKFLL